MANYKSFLPAAWSNFVNKFKQNTTLVVDSLPTASASMNGQVRFNRADNKTYKCVSGAWTDITTSKGVNDHKTYTIAQTGYTPVTSTTGSDVDYEFGLYGSSSLQNLVNPSTIYSSATLLDGKFTFTCSLTSAAYTNTAGTHFYGNVAVGRKYIVDSLNTMLGTSFTYAQFSTWATANPMTLTSMQAAVEFYGEPGVEELAALSSPSSGSSFPSTDGSSIGSISHYNGYRLAYSSYIIYTLSAGSHAQGVTAVGSMKVTIDVAGFIAAYS